MQILSGRQHGGNTTTPDREKLPIRPLLRKASPRHAELRQLVTQLYDGRRRGSDEWLIEQCIQGEKSDLWNELAKLNANESQLGLHERFPGIDIATVARLYVRVRKRCWKLARDGEPLPGDAEVPLFG